MAIEQNFRKRARETRAYLRSLQDIESRLQNGRGFYRAPKAVAASRAAAYIMIYNCVEYAVREAVVSVRHHVRDNVADLSSLKVYWREDIVRAHFQSRLTQGGEHVQLISDISAFLPGKVSWKSAKNEKAIPFNGNIDHERLIEFLHKIGAKRFRPPQGTLGGSDLFTVRNIRNDLAHGDEGFEEVGSQVTTQDLIEKLERIRAFVIAFITCIERYRDRQHYLA